MEFDKYKKRGDYHWREFKSDTIYRQHVLKVLDWIEEDSVLDVGAGDGLITHELRQRGKDATGIDSSPHALRIARQKGVPVVAGDAYDLPRGRQYDAVFLGDVIEHLEFPGRCIEQVGQVLAEGGSVYIVTPPQAPDGRVQDKYHYFEFTPDEMIGFMAGLGYTVVDKEVIRQWKRMYMRFQRAAA